MTVVAPGKGADDLAKMFNVRRVIVVGLASLTIAFKIGLAAELPEPAWQIVADVRLNTHLHGLPARTRGGKRAVDDVPAVLSFFGFQHRPEPAAVRQRGLRVFRIDQVFTCRSKHLRP